MPAITSVTATASGALIWSNWNQVATSSTNYSVAVGTIWPSWTTTASTTAGVWPSFEPRMGETAEQRASRVEQEARQVSEWKAIAERNRIEREAANRRAEALLHAHLDREQQQQLAERDWFLHVSASGKRYRINRGRSANIDVLDEQGKVVRSLCAHPRLEVPDADTMLAQALMLKHEEDEFLRLANVHPIGHGFRRRQLAPEERAA